MRNTNNRQKDISRMMRNRQNRRRDKPVLQKPPQKPFPPKPPQKPA